MSERRGSENDIRGSFTPGACRWWLHKEGTFWRQGQVFFLTGSSCRKAVDMNHDTQQNSHHILSLLGISTAINVSNSFSSFAALWVSGTHFRTWWQQRNVGHRGCQWDFCHWLQHSCYWLAPTRPLQTVFTKTPLEIRQNIHAKYLGSLFHGLFSPHSVS